MSSKNHQTASYDENREQLDALWLVVRLRDELYATPVAGVHSLVTPGPVTPMPHQPSHIRGVFSLRGVAIVLRDLRRTLGMPSIVEDIASFAALMDARCADHLNWLENLRRSTETGEPFTGAIDPNLCAFGKWYTQFKTDDWALNQILKAFDAPHRRIHEIAAEVQACMGRRELAAAQQIIADTEHTELQQMIKLFERAKEAYAKSRREIAVVLADGKQALAVDDVLGVETLIPYDDVALHTPLCSGIARRRQTDATVMLLESNALAA